MLRSLPDQLILKAEEPTMINEASQQVKLNKTEASKNFG
jgi:hypothetical protein